MLSIEKHVKEINKDYPSVYQYIERQARNEVLFDIQILLKELKKADINRNDSILSVIIGRLNKIKNKHRY